MFSTVGFIIGYPEGFKEKVLLVFGDSEKLRKSLDEGQEIVGRLLDDGRLSSFEAKEIVETCESLIFSELYQRAKRQ